MPTAEPGSTPVPGAVLHHAALSPVFGSATLDNCEREQIHLAGSIQPHGALLRVREPDLLICQASDNIAELLPELAAPWLDRRLEDILPLIAASIRPHLAEALDEIPLAIRSRDGRLDLLLHRPASGGLVIEIEQAGPPIELAGPIESSLRTIVGSANLAALCDEAAWIFRELTGYDRVMVYRFDEEGHGAVISEQRRADLEAFLGNRYPSTDIPHIARRLYERNRVRVLVDVHFTPVPITPRTADDTEAEIDMSLCVLRSSSPIHVQYLKNMGVCATLVVSLMVNGRLWGLISCHHYSPREVHFEARAVCELLAEAVATRIAALESFVQSQVELSVRRIEQRIIESISREGDWRVSLFDGSNLLLTPLDAAGAALLFEGQCLTVGDVPGTQQLREIGLWLDEHLRSGVPRTVFASTALSIDAPRFASIADVASGLLAVTVSNTPGEYLIWFRPEQIQTVTWGGDPTKAMEIGDDPSQLSPRRSFAQWHQRVEGTSAAWSEAQMTAARLIGETVTDVVQQFRAVRMLIAQDQLEQVSGQVVDSDQPVIIADETGRLLLVNDAFARLLPEGAPPLTSLSQLPALFYEPGEVRQRLSDLRLARRTWRGEVLLKARVGMGQASAGMAMLVRADPVFSSPQRVLGFVLMFTDLTERKDAEQARRLFQQSIVQGQRIATRRLDSQAGLAAQNLLTSMLENAQLAAMEITDGVDTAGMARRLESVRASVQRASNMLERLIRHAQPPG